MEKLKNLLTSVTMPKANLILSFFTVNFFIFIYYDWLKIREYPKEYTIVYIMTLLGVTAANLLKKSRFMR